MVWRAEHTLEQMVPRVWGLQGANTAYRTRSPGRGWMKIAGGIPFF